MKKTKRFVSNPNDTLSEITKVISPNIQDNADQLNAKVQQAIDHYTNNEINDALRTIKHLLPKHPNIAILYTIKGTCLAKKQQFDLAIDQYKLALKITPENGDIYYNLGNAYLKKALLIEEDYPEAFFNSDIIDSHKDRLKSAVDYFKKALTCKPDCIDTLNNLGITYSHLDEFVHAIDCFKKSIQFLSKNPKAYFNLGIVYQKLLRFDLEIECYRKAINIKPNYIDANWNLALVQLLNGQFNEGWKNYKWRFKKEEKFQLRSYSKPLWDGSSLKNKTLFIYHEQGVGDTLQFIRYVKVLSNQSAKIIFECPFNLLGLMSKIPEITHFTIPEKELPDFDFYVPMMSIPAILNTDLKNIPKNIPYLFTEKKPQNHLLQDTHLLKIGIVWAGNPKHQQDRNRSIELSSFKPLLALEGTQFYSLQFGERSSDLTLDSTYAKVIDLSSELNDYEDTASIIQQLDLVITVDTSVAHLAGAMGQPVWLLLPFIPDWRWLMDRTDSPWYPTMRLFRQQTYKDWHPVFTQLRRALKQQLNMNVADLRLLKLLWPTIHAFRNKNIPIGIHYLNDLLVMVDTFSKKLHESTVQQIKLLLKQALIDLKAQNYSDLSILLEEELLPLLDLSLANHFSLDN